MYRITVNGGLSGRRGMRRVAGSNEVSPSAPNPGARYARPRPPSTFSFKLTHYRQLERRGGGSVERRTLTPTLSQREREKDSPREREKDSPDDGPQSLLAEAFHT